MIGRPVCDGQSWLADCYRRNDMQLEILGAFYPKVSNILVLNKMNGFLSLFTVCLYVNFILQPPLRLKISWKPVLTTFYDGKCLVALATVNKSAILGGCTKLDWHYDGIKFVNKSCNPVLRFPKLFPWMNINKKNKEESLPGKRFYGGKIRHVNTHSAANFTCFGKLSTAILVWGSYSWHTTFSTALISRIFRSSAICIYACAWHTA